MTPRERAQLPAAIDAALAAWPVPERSEAEWDKAAEAVAARLASTKARPDDAALLAAPLPREEGEPEVWVPTATPRPVPQPAPRVGEVSLADLARSKVAAPDQRERRLEVAKQSLDHLARARSRGEIADSIQRTAEARSQERNSQPSLPPPVVPARPSRGVVVALGVLAAAAAALVVIELARQPGPPPTGAVALTPTTVSAPPAAGVVTAPTKEEPVARFDDLPATEAGRGDPAAAPDPRRPGAASPRAATRAEAAPPTAGAPSAEPDEFATPLTHAEGRTTALAPTTGEAIAALAPSLGRAKLCVAGHAEPSTARITFASDGSVSGVAVSGPAAGTPAGACIESALRAARVAPFAKPSFSVSYPVRP